MAPHLVDAGCRFDNVYCSPAVRAVSTIELISQNLPALSIQWQIEDELYSFDSEDIYHWCRSLNESVNEILVVGHNPAFTEFCNELSNSDISNIPTCGYVQLTGKNKTSWRDLSGNYFELTKFLRPKEFMV